MPDEHGRLTFEDIMKRKGKNPDGTPIVEEVATPDDVPPDVDDVAPTTTFVGTGPRPNRDDFQETPIPVHPAVEDRRVPFHIRDDIDEDVDE